LDIQKIKLREENNQRDRERAGKTWDGSQFEKKDDVGLALHVWKNMKDWYIHNSMIQKY
jgi:hypothetical protein